jgi:transposase
MAMGKKRGWQGGLWIATSDLARSPGHPFYERLNRLLEQYSFDTFVEEQCRIFYAERLGRPSLPPGTYFRLLLIGYFEGIDSERGIAWRVADSLTLREFLGLTLSQTPPDHSTISRNRRLIDVETHQEVFAWVLGVLGQEGLLRGQTIGVDATTLEANAALKSIVRRDTGEGYGEFLQRLAQESGEATPTRAELARKDRKRKGKGSNDDWTNPHDPDAKITKMKNGSTHLAHKAEHAVDLETGAIVAVTIQPADRGDTQSLEPTLSEALENLAAMAEQASLSEMALGEVVADRGYHSGAVLVRLQELGVRSYIAEPKRPRRKWRGRLAQKNATYANHRRMKGPRGKRLSRWRCEKVERSMAHSYETGNLRRLHLRGHENILKRLLIHEAGFNLSLVMRQRFGQGTPRGFQGRLRPLLALAFSLLPTPRLAFWARSLRNWTEILLCQRELLPVTSNFFLRQKLAFTTGC